MSGSAVRDFQPVWGIVLGSGLDAVASAVQCEGQITFAEVEGMPAPRVPGHGGRFVWGRVGEVKVLVQCGRVHLYEGHAARAVTAGIRWMAECGVRRLLLTNAAGTLRPQHPPGHWMLLTDHLNLTGTSPLTGAPAYVDLSEVYSARLRRSFQEAAAEQGMPLHTGVYAGVAGPQYETPAEIRMLATLGADAVGMSTVLEAIQARALGLEVAAFSCLTNWAAGIAPAPLDHAEVLSTSRQAADAFADLLRAVLPQS